MDSRELSGVVKPNKTRYYTSTLGNMTTCFPTTKYIFFFISFVLAFTLANKSNKLEVFGIGLMFGINYLYSLFIGNDVLNYIQRHRNLWGGWTGLGVSSIISGLIFNFVSSILILISMVRMHLANGQKMSLNAFGRKDFNVFKRLMIASIVLIGVVSANLYFTPDTIATRVTSLIGAITEPTQQIHIFQFLCTVVAIGLFFSVIDITDFKLKADKRLDKFRESFKNMYAILITLVILIVLRAYLAFQMPQFLTLSVGRIVGFDMLFDTAKWVLTLCAIVFWGISIADFDHLGKPYFNRAHKEEDTEETKYFNRYHKFQLRSKFIFFMLFTIFLLLCNLVGSTHFIELLLLIVKVFAPLAVMGITAYSVYLANNFSKKSSHQVLVQPDKQVVTEKKKTIVKDDKDKPGKRSSFISNLISQFYLP